MSKSSLTEPLFTVGGHLAERYAAALQHATGLACPLDSFAIDRLGWSPQLAALLGEGYLQAEALRYAIVLSPDQADAPVIWRRYSYEAPLIGRVYEEARGTLLNLIEHEPIIVEIDNGLTFCRAASDLLGVQRAAVCLETPRDTLAKSQRLLGMATGLAERARLLDDDYIDEMLALVGQVGDPRKRPLPPEIAVGVRSLWAEVDGAAYVLRPPEGQAGDTIVIATRPDSALARLPVTALELDAPRVVDVLHEAGYLRYGNEQALLEKRIGELEIDALLTAGVTPLDEDDGASRRRQLSRSAEARAALPPLYWELDAEQKRRAAGGRFEPQHLSPEARWALSTPARDTEIIVNLLARFVRYDYRLLLNHQRRSVQGAWERYGEAKRRYIQGIAPYIEEGFVTTGGRRQTPDTP